MRRKKGKWDLVPTLPAFVQRSPPLLGFASTDRLDDRAMRVSLRPLCLTIGSGPSLAIAAPKVGFASGSSPGRSALHSEFQLFTVNTVTSEIHDSFASVE